MFAPREGRRLFRSGAARGARAPPRASRGGARGLRRRRRRRRARARARRRVVGRASSDERGGDGDDEASAARAAVLTRSSTRSSERAPTPTLAGAVATDRDGAPRRRRRRRRVRTSGSGSGTSGSGLVSGWSDAALAEAAWAADRPANARSSASSRRDGVSALAASRRCLRFRIFRPPRRPVGARGVDPEATFEPRDVRLIPPRRRRERARRVRRAGGEVHRLDKDAVANVADAAEARDSPRSFKRAVAEMDGAGVVAENRRSERRAREMARAQPAPPRRRGRPHGRG